jgi:hypothetical protein
MRSIRRPALEYEFEPVQISTPGSIKIPSWLQYNYFNLPSAVRNAQAPCFCLQGVNGVNLPRFEEVGPDSVAGIFPGVRGLSMERASVNVLENSGDFSAGTWTLTDCAVDTPGLQDAAGGNLASSIQASGANPTITGVGFVGATASTQSVWARIVGFPQGASFQFYCDSSATMSLAFTPDNHWRRYSFTGTTVDFNILLSSGALIEFCYGQLEESLYAQSTIGPTPSGAIGRNADRLIIDPSVANDLLKSGFYDIEMVIFPKFEQASAGSPTEINTDCNLFYVSDTDRVWLGANNVLHLSTFGMPDLTMGSPGSPIVYPRFQPLRITARSTPKGRRLGLVQGTGPLNENVDPAPATPFGSGPPLFICGSAGSDGADQSVLLYYLAIHWPII